MARLALGHQNDVLSGGMAAMKDEGGKK